MAGDVKLVYTISKESAKLVKAGLAEVSSGGVRDIATKQLIELAKPAVSSVLDNVISPITMVSSLANNAQSAFIQKGVNQANAKLDLSLAKMDQIQNAVNALAKSNALNWVNCAVGMVNCGITVAGFYMTLHKLDEVSGQIQNLSNVIEKSIVSKHLREFDEYRFFIQSDVGRMKEGTLPVVQSGNIEEHLGKIAAYLKSVIRDFENRDIDGELGCTIIFNLGIAFAKEINEYSAHYYYETGKMPPSYNDWVAVLESINSPSFKEHLKRYLFFECPNIKMEDKYSTFSTVMFAIETQLGELEFTKNLIPQIEKKEYMNLDDFLGRRIQNNLFFEVDDKVCIPIS